MNKSGPLQGVRVIDLSTVISGPMAGSLLADQGADVIKVEATGIGDMGRYVGASRNGMSGFFHLANRGKRSIAVDLKQAAGIDIVLKLCEKADVLIQNFRPGVTDRLGIGYETARERNQQLIYLSISGFGPEGPLAEMPAFDSIIQSFAGFADLQRESASDPPHLVQNFVVDKLTALNASQAVCAALVARAQTRGGQHIQLSMLDCAANFLWIDSAMAAALPGDGVRHQLPPAKVTKLTRFKNGWASFSPSTDEAFHGMCRALGVDSSDPRVKTLSARMQNLDESRKIMDRCEARAAELDVDAAVALLQECDVPCAKVRTLTELPEQPQSQASALFEQNNHSVLGTILEPRPAARFTATPAQTGAPAPRLGEHTDEILKELGLEKEVEALRAGRIVQ